MSRRRKTVTAQYYIWDAGKPTAKPGIALRTSNGRIIWHLSYTASRKLADALHDLVDAVDNDGEVDLDALVDKH